MNFYENQIFHIYNQGNNKANIFFSNENYSYFLWKMKAYLLPFGELVSYCLMPNHFHLQLLVNKVEIKRIQLRKHVIETEIKRRQHEGFSKSYNSNFRGEYKASAEKMITLNESLGILMRSYTNAINRSYGKTGSLFRQGCKAKCGWLNQFITIDESIPRYVSRTLDYDHMCFNYIHDNPVKAKLVENASDYFWSSAKEYAGLCESPICNLELGFRLSKNEASDA